MTALLITTAPFLLITLALAARALHRRRIRARQHVTTLLSDPRQCLAFFGSRCTAARPSRLILPPVGHDMPAWGSSKASIEAWHNKFHPVAR
jgi:hypothetical protein